MLQTLDKLKQIRSLRLIIGGNSEFHYYLKIVQQTFIYYTPWGNPFFRNFSKNCSDSEMLICKRPLRSVMMRKLERALKERQLDEAWGTYEAFKSFYGFPDQFLVSNLITELAYSSDPKCILRAFDLVVSISAKRSCSLDMMTKLLVSLARAQKPVQTSRILRIMLDKNRSPSLDVLQMVFLHLVKTQIGTCLASNIIGEICDCFQRIKSNKSADTVLTMPNTTIFNLVLEGCVKFGFPLKGQQIVELMPKVGVLADVQTVFNIAHIHELNGMRDELKKFKDYIDMVPVNLARNCSQFYSCLLSLNFKFNDIDAASALLLNICELCELNHIQRSQKVPQKPFSVSIGSDNIKMGFRLQFLPVQVHKDSVYEMDSKLELIVSKKGKLVLTKKGLAKLIVGYKRSGRIDDLSKLLIHIKAMLQSSESDNLFFDVIVSCICMGWLETAHDILEDLETENYSVGKDSYLTLLIAYRNKNMFREAEGLLRRIRKVYPDLNVSNEISSSSPDPRGTQICELDLTKAIMQNLKPEDNSVSYMVYECNSSIYFFTKAKMIGDAVMTYRKMQGTKIRPTETTFFFLICGYSSLKMYREVTILWGDIKRSMSDQKTVYNKDLYELLLLNFIRGGYFQRVMEVVGVMMKNSMYLDKWSYKSEFLKHHRDLYWRLTTADAKNEAQSQRIEYVRAFRKWVGVL